MHTALAWLFLLAANLFFTLLLSTKCHSTALVGSPHSATEVWHVPQEVLVGIVPLHSPTSSFHVVVSVQVETVEAQLPLETRQLGLFEIARDDVTKELFALVYLKAPALVNPRNDIRSTRRFNFSQKSVQPFWERFDARASYHRKSIPVGTTKPRWLTQLGCGHPWKELLLLLL